jgi:hypothetical protein
VIQLPRHLAPWAPHLGLFPEEIALVLGPMIARIASLIGTAPRDLAQEGEPNGYDGIAQKGPYERLLAAEWLLQEEVPDEFLRRAVSGEHLFLQRAFQEQAAAKHTIALFDAGASQLGSPRIAHIATLIVLAQRALRQGANLQWGVLQDACLGLNEGVSKGTVLALLQARRARPGNAADLDRWLSLPAIVHAPEVWCIGAEGLAVGALSRKLSALTVAEILEPGDPQRIRVAAHTAKAGRPKETALEIPRGKPAVQLLRDPFGTASGAWQAASHRIDIRSNIVFSPDGRRLYVRGANGTLLTFWVPNSPKGKPRRSAMFTPPEGHIIVAIGQSAGRKRSLVISQRGTELMLHRLSKRGAAANQTQLYTAGREGDVLPDARDLPLRPAGVLKDRLCFVHADGSIVELAQNRYEIARETAVASKSAHEAFVYIRLRHNVPEVLAVRLDKAGNVDISKVAVELPRAESDTRYYFGVLGLSNLVTYSRSTSLSTIVHRQQSTTGGIPQSHTLIGMIERGDSSPAAIAIDGSRLRIEALRPGGRETLVIAAAPIAFAAASEAAPVIAYITEAGELGVYSCTANAMVLRVAAEG